LKNITIPFAFIIFLGFSGFINCWAIEFSRLPLQGEWEIIKVDSFNIGTMDDIENVISVGNKMIISGNVASVTIAGRKYERDLTNVLYSLKTEKLGEDDAFNEKWNNRLSVNDLGLKEDLRIDKYETKDSRARPFIYFMLLENKNQLLFFVETSIFLCQRTKTTGVRIKHGDPNCDVGWQKINDLKNEEAILSFRKAADIDPNNADAYFGWAYVLLQNYIEEKIPNANEAIEKFQMVLNIKSATPELKKAASMYIADTKDLMKTYLSLTPGNKVTK